MWACATAICAMQESVVSTEAGTAEITIPVVIREVAPHECLSNSMELLLQLCYLFQVPTFPQRPPILQPQQWLPHGM